MGSEGFQRAIGKPFGRAKAFDTIHLDGIERSLRDLTFPGKVNLAGAKSLRRGKQEQTNAAALLQRKERKP